MTTRDPQTGLSDPPPSAMMLQLIAGFWVSHALSLSPLSEVANKLSMSYRSITTSRPRAPRSGLLVWRASRLALTLWFESVHHDRAVRRDHELGINAEYHIRQGAVAN